MQQAQRAAFLAAPYGTPRERFGLADRPPVAAPSWAAHRWAIVTAWNPGGGLQPRADNLRAGRALLALVAPRPHLPGVNGEGQWAEASVIVPGLRLREAAELGRRFGQAAVLFGVGRRVALVWLEANGVCVERYWVRLLPD